MRAATPTPALNRRRRAAENTLGHARIQPYSAEYGVTFIHSCSDPAHPKLAGRIWLGGSVRAGGPVRVLGGLPEDTPEAPVAPTVQGHEVLGGPQMIQLRWGLAAKSPT